MATKLQNLALEIAHYNNFEKYIPNIGQYCKETLRRILNLGGTQVSTLFEHAVAQEGGHQVVSLDKGDLERNGVYSDAKLSSVRTSSYGTVYSAPIRNTQNKVGTIRVQIYERKQNKFYYFAIPFDAHKEVPKSSNIEIPFEMDGTPRRIPLRRVNMNWWMYEVKTFQDMAIVD